LWLWKNLSRINDSPHLASILLFFVTLSHLLIKSPHPPFYKKGGKGEINGLIIFKKILMSNQKLKSPEKPFFALLITEIPKNDYTDFPSFSMHF